MKVKDLKIEDVLNMKEYKEELTRIIGELKQIRDDAREKAFRNRDTLYSHPIDRLIKGDLFSSSVMIAEYKDFLNRKSSKPKAIRDFIFQVCTEAFNNVMRKLIKDEEEADKRNGEDK